MNKKVESILNENKVKRVKATSTQHLRARILVAHVLVHSVFAEREYRRKVK